MKSLREEHIDIQNWSLLLIITSFSIGVLSMALSKWVFLSFLIIIRSFYILIKKEKKYLNRLDEVEKQLEMDTYMGD